MSVYDNAKSVLERIAEASVKSGRNPDDVLLTAASKMNSADRVREAFGAGVHAFGENRVQEMEEKLTAGAYDGAELHFIGHLQRNKVKNVTGKVKLIQSVDSTELVELIGKRATSLGITQDILIEVNIGREESKSGVLTEELEELLEFASKTKGIFVKGLMTIPPANENSQKTRGYFDQMSNLFVDMSGKKYDNVSMNFLSMGMSRDFEEAILAGANIVRVGSAIFGERIYT
jgi:pyridoxal phosphate enzyme (YggS family)